MVSRTDKRRSKNMFKRELTVRAKSYLPDLYRDIRGLLGKNEAGIKPITFWYLADMSQSSKMMAAMQAHFTTAGWSRCILLGGFIG